MLEEQPDLKIAVSCGEAEYSLVEVGKFSLLICAALRKRWTAIKAQQNIQHEVCDELVASFDDPERNPIRRVFLKPGKSGVTGTGIALAEQYQQLRI
ncbi:hypothetical protein WDV93_20070 [Pantoea ananatis]